MLGNQFSVFVYPNGCITTCHCDPHNNITRFADGDRVYVETRRDDNRDFKIYGEEPTVGRVTEKMYYFVHDTKYEATLVSIPPLSPLL